MLVAGIQIKAVIVATMFGAFFTGIDTFTFFARNGRGIGVYARIVAGTACCGNRQVRFTAVRWIVVTIGKLRLT